MRLGRLAPRLVVFWEVGYTPGLQGNHKGKRENGKTVARLGAAWSVLEVEGTGPWGGGVYSGGVPDSPL